MLGPQGLGPWKVSGMPHRGSVELKVKTLMSRGKGLAETFSVLPRARQRHFCSSWGGEPGSVLHSARRGQPSNWIEPGRRQSLAGPSAVSGLRERTDSLARDRRGTWMGEIPVSFPAT